MARKIDESAEELRKCGITMLEKASNLQIIDEYTAKFDFEGQVYYLYLGKGGSVYLGEGSPNDPPPQ